MAKIGLNNFRFAVATVAADGSITYGGAQTPGKAVSFNFEPAKSDATLYADDGVAERDTRVTGGTATMGIDRLDDNTISTLLGHTIDDGEVISNQNDVAPYVSVGRVARLMVGGVQKFRATFFALCQFSEPSDSDNTLGESVEFSTYELEGAVIMPKSGDWRKEQTFDTQADAVAYLEGLMAAPTSA